MNAVFSNILGAAQDAYAKAHAPAERITGHFRIDGVTIARVEKAPSADVRFLSQRQLRALATPEATAELRRRAEIAR